MTFDDLRAFIAAYEARSMSEAGRQLGCTQAAVAQHVRRLERELGAELFLRLRRGVAPTPVGTTLFTAAVDSLAQLDRATHEIARVVTRQRARLRLSTSAGIVQTFLRGYLMLLKERHPDVEVIIEPANTADKRLGALRDGRSDIAMVPLTQEVRGFDVRPYRVVELALLVHPEHAFAARRKVHASELGCLRYIAQSHSSGTYRHLEQALAKAGVSVTPVEVAEDAATANLLVELGRGQTFVPLRLARQLQRTQRVRAVRVDALPPLTMVWAARNFELLPTVATDFMALCDDQDSPAARLSPRPPLLA